MNEKPHVSVILPTRNRAHLLPRALDSVLKQDYTNFELIIVNNGSTDNTDDIVQSYLSKDDRIRYIRHEKDEGIPGARNHGLREARGVYIAWQDDDDEWLPGKLAKSLQKFESLPQEYGVVYHAFWRIRPNGEKMSFPPPWVKPLEGNLHKIFCKKNFLPLQAMLLRKEVFDRVGELDARYLVLGEYDWFPKISKIYKFGYVPEFLCVLYYTPSSNSQNNVANAETRLIFMQDNWEDLKRYGFIGYHYSVIGDLYIDGKKYGMGAAYYLKALWHEPFHIVHLAKVICSLLRINYKSVRKKFPFMASGKEFNV